MKNLNSTKETDKKSFLFYKGEVTKYHDYNNSRHDGLIVHFKGIKDERTETEPSSIKGHPIDVGSTFYEVDTGLSYTWTGSKWKLTSKKLTTELTSDEPKPENPEKNDTVFELDTGKKYYWSGTQWLEVGWNTKPVPPVVEPKLLSAHVWLTDEGGSPLSEKDITVEGNIININAGLEVAKCILGRFEVSPEDTKIYWNGNVVETIQVFNTEKIYLNNKVEYVINLVK